MRSVILIAISTVFAAAAFGQASQPAGGIERFIDDNTVAVMWMDVQRVAKDTDWEKLSEIIVKAADAADPDSKGSGARDMIKGLLAFRDGAEKLVAAGAERVYAVVNMADLPSDPPIVVKIKPGSDIQKIRALLPLGQGQSQEAVLIDGWLVISTQEQIDRMKKSAPVPRADLAKAIAEAQGGAVGAVAAPTDTVRKVIAEMMPNLPQEVGGGKSTLVTEGVFWIAARADLPPKMSVNVVIQSKSEQAAKDLHGAIEKFSNEMSQPAKAPATSGSGVAEPKQLDLMRLEAQRMFPDLKKFLTLVTPKLQKDRLVLSLDAEQVKTLVDQFGPVLAKVRQDARRQASAANLNALARGMVMYGAMYKDRFPPNLQAMVKENLISEKNLVDPMDPTSKVGYIYARPPGTFNDVKVPGRTPVFYQAKSFDGKVVVAMADSHVEIMTEKEFQALLAKVTTIPASKPDEK